MKPNISSQPSAGGTLIRCSIETADIEEMDYWLNEASMADITRQNAFSLALRRLLAPKIDVSLSHRGPDRFDVNVGGRLKFKLSEPLSNWLNRAFTGHLVEPTVEWVRLPWGLLCPSVQTAMRRVHSENIRVLPLLTVTQIAA